MTLTGSRARGSPGSSGSAGCTHTDSVPAPLRENAATRWPGCGMADEVMQAWVGTAVPVP
ncbi:hypothetical protein MN0502_23700 [Arthrobacter sp. MN05-02]|nr:hypothetical protein MN0502_23700 [Arthrobacter sp. MN05-02]